MIHNKDIIIFGLQPWDISIGSNCKNIAIELAKHNRVLYVNRPLDRRAWLEGKQDNITQNRLAVLKGEKEALELVQDNLWVLTPPIIMESLQWFKSYRLFQWFNKRNNRKLANIIQEYRHQLGFEDFILFNDSAMFQGSYLNEFLNPEWFIYYIRDYLIAQPYFKKHGAQAEQAIIQQADIVVTNSTYLMNYAKQYNEESYYIGQGCDLEFFNVEQVQESHPLLKDIHQPIIGYVGALTSQRLDVDLLVWLAQRNPQWTFVFIGKEDEVFQNSALHQCANVRFLGFQKMDVLASFIYGFDVCINPQLKNEMSEGNYPRKIDEYLAMGKPVVATRTKGMEVFKDFVGLASSKEAFEVLIQTVLNKTNPINPQERIAFAQSHTWENSLLSMWKAMLNHRA